VAWFTNNANIASVTQGGLVTASGVGSTTITAQSVEGGKRATCMVTARGYGGIAPPAQMSVEEADNEIAAFSTQMREDYDYLVAIGFEDDAYIGFYAVASCVRNRVNSPHFPNSYKNVVQAQNQFSGYRPSEIGLPRTVGVKIAAVKVLGGRHSTVKDYLFFRSSKSNIWFNSVAVGSNLPIVIDSGRKDIDNRRNVYYMNYGDVNIGNSSTGDIILFFGGSDRWYDQ